MTTLLRLRRMIPTLSPKGRPLGLYPFELLAIGMALSAILFLRLNHLTYGWDTVAYTFPPLIRALPRLFVLGIGLRLVLQLITRRPIKEYVGVVFRWQWLQLWLRGWVGIMLFIYTYCWLKISVPLVRTDLYDQALWKLDRFLHLGFSPSVFAIELVAGTPLAPFFDWWYGLWVTSLSVIMAFFFATESGRRLRNFTLAVILLWTLGAWGYMASPALGPCYASPDMMAPILDEIPGAVKMQEVLWSQYLQMVKGRTGLLRTFRPEFGVAAMPSLHVGAHALFFFWCRRHDRWLRVPAAIATGLTLFGSVVTGWHYAIDGYAGILLAWFAVAAADRLDPIPSSTASDAANGPEGATETAASSPPSPAAE